MTHNDIRQTAALAERRHWQRELLHLSSVWRGLAQQTPFRDRADIYQANAEIIEALVAERSK